MSKPSKPFKVDRRQMLGGLATAGVAAATGMSRPDHAFAQSTKSGVVRVWGEPGPYGGVAVAAMNEWAQKNVR